MRHLIVRILFFIPLLTMTCMVKAQCFQPYKSAVIEYGGYVYPIVPGTDNWKNISYEQRLVSLQLPTDTLQHIATSRLLETCLYYPFNIDIFAFDDQIGSFERVKNQFNGYAELYQRSDFVQQLINLYNSRNISFIDQITLDYDKGLYAFDFKIMEFMLTDAAYLASNTQAVQIATMLLEKMDQRAQHHVYGDSNILSISLAIGRCLQRATDFSDYQGTTLQGFLQSGKPTNPNDLEYIFNKARTL
ncbi:MAG: hypothetical protein IKT08_05430 [Bacteroidales bacterium]|nr:hypothetical protein [Bacteroidales bacterium]